MDFDTPSLQAARAKVAAAAAASYAPTAIPGSPKGAHLATVKVESAGRGATEVDDVDRAMRTTTFA